ncbi:MAG: hypothetical protein HUK20_14755 [Fibrobacter sp.]|nr:hypothetical protein [Fibrobacter sp.]
MKNRDSEAKKNGLFCWTERQQRLLDEAQKGAKESAAQLFVDMYDLVKRVHDHSQSGYAPRNFGYSFNASGETFESASGRLYLDFCNCISKYEEYYGVPFAAFVVQQMQFREKDYVRDEKEYRDKWVSLSMPKAEVAQWLEKLLVDCDAENRMIENIHTKDAMNKIRQKVADMGDVRLIDFLSLYMEYGDEKCVMVKVAEKMGVTRTMAYNYLKRITEMVRFGGQNGANLAA